MEIRKRRTAALIVGILVWPLVPTRAAVAALKELPAGAQFTADGIGCYPLYEVPPQRYSVY